MLLYELGINISDKYNTDVLGNPRTKYDEHVSIQKGLLRFTSLSYNLHWLSFTNVYKYTNSNWIERTVVNKIIDFFTMFLLKKWY